MEADLEEEQEEQQIEEQQQLQEESNEGNIESDSQGSDNEKQEKENLKKFLEMAENEEMNQFELDEEVDDDEDENEEGKNAKYSDLWGEESEQQSQEQEEDAMEDEIFDEMREQELDGNQQQIAINSREHQINKLEQKLISQKSWQLKGEIGAKSRPQDSLIQENLDFKSGIRLQEEITKEDNDNLERIIKQRIIDQLWDDNEQNNNNANDIQENFNSLADINFEKPKGLAETYEDEYKKSVLQLPTAKPEDKAKAEIELQFKQLCYKLDLLSNLNFTPKPLDSKPAEILTNVPTIMREENIPIFVSSKQVLNASELFKSKKDATFFDKQELNPEQKVKLRQKMKKNFKSRQRHSLLKKKISKLSASNKFAYTLMQKNKKQQKIMEGMKKEKSVKFTKSAEFFKNLQENQDVKKQQPKKKK